MGVISGSDLGLELSDERLWDMREGGGVGGVFVISLPVSPFSVTPPNLFVLQKIIASIRHLITPRADAVLQINIFVILWDLSKTHNDGRHQKQHLNCCLAFI